MEILFSLLSILKLGVTIMSEKEISQPNVRLGGKIAKEKGRTNGELGNDQDIKADKNRKK